MYTSISNCRHCSTKLLDLIDLGNVPIADDLIDIENLYASIKMVPLHLAFCPKCSLLQIREDVNPNILFQQNYPYHTGAIPQMVEHFTHASKSIVQKLKLNNTATVFEVACNDGTNLKNYKKMGFNTLGIDPALEPVNIARSEGLRVYHDFFSSNIIEKYSLGGTVDLLIACNVLAHVPDINSFIEGVKKCLKPKGVAVFEIPYAVDMIQKTEFDTIFHQHYSYFTLNSLSTIFSMANLFIYDVEKISVHGGSIRIFVSQKRKRKRKTLIALENEECRLGVSSLAFYKHFSDEVKNLRNSFMSLLNNIISEGLRVEGYGAAGKATTMIAYFGINQSHINVIGDINPFKHGKYFPGIKIPIVSPETLMKDTPSYIIIFCWNYAEHVIKQLRQYDKQDVKFIIPLPKPKII